MIKSYKIFGIGIGVFCFIIFIVDGCKKKENTEDPNPPIDYSVRANWISIPLVSYETDVFMSIRLPGNPIALMEHIVRLRIIKWCLRLLNYSISRQPPLTQRMFLHPFTDRLMLILFWILLFPGVIRRQLSAAFQPRM